MRSYASTRRWGQRGRTHSGGLYKRGGLRSSGWVSVDRGCWREAAIRRGVRTKAKRAAKQGGRGVRGDWKVRDLFPRLVFRLHWRQRSRIQRTQRRTTRKKDPRVEEVTGRARSLAQSGFCESSNQLSNSSRSCSSTNPLLRSSSSINQGRPSPSLSICVRNRPASAAAGPAIESLPSQSRAGRRELTLASRLAWDLVIAFNYEGGEAPLASVCGEGEKEEGGEKRGPAFRRLLHFCSPRSLLLLSRTAQPAS